MFDSPLEQNMKFYLSNMNLYKTWKLNSSWNMKLENWIKNEFSIINKYVIYKGESNDSKKNVSISLNVYLVQYLKKNKICKQKKKINKYKTKFY